MKEAITISGRSRIRPILMTAFTTILGMVPMAVSSGEGAEMWQPLGIVVIGGLTVSTFLTLFLVPVLYGSMNIISNFFKRLLGLLKSIVLFNDNDIIKAWREFRDMWLLAWSGELMEDEEKEAIRRKSFIFMDLKVKKGEEK
jgi:predicted RND superfamily exporter protein